VIAPLAAALLALGAADEPPRPYALDELVQMALRNQPKLRAAADAERAALERLGEAHAPDYPQVDGYAEYVRSTYNNTVTSFWSIDGIPRIGGHTAVDTSILGAAGGGAQNAITADNNDNYLLGLVASYDVVDFGRTASGIRAAQADIDRAREDSLVATEGVVFQVRQAYYGILAAEALQATAIKTLAEAKTHFDWAHEAVKDGLRAPVDEAQARADVTRAQLALVRAQAGVRVARVRLLQAIGEKGTLEIEVAPPAPIMDVPQDEGALLDRAYRERPDLLSLAAQRRQAEAQASRVRADFLPFLDAQGAAYLMGADPGLPTSLSTVPNVNLGLVLGVPIFEGFLTTHQLREAQAKIDIAREREADLELTVHEQVREAYVNFKSALEAIAAADDNQKAAEEELHVTSGRYNNGLGSILDLLVAQAAAVAAEDEAIGARYQAGVARSLLDLAVGAPPPALAKGGS